MSAFALVGGEWVDVALLARSAGEFGDPNDNGYVQDAGELKQFQPGASVAGFAGPENLAAAPTSTAVVLTWTDRVQVVVPTNVEVRIPEVSPVYTEYSFGTLASGYSALTPATTYQAQVRYVVRSPIDGTITRYSSPTTLFFTTPAAIAPSFPAPGPTPGPISIIKFPPTPGGPSCTWSYTLQIDAIPPNEVVIVWTDTAVTGTGHPSGADASIDFVAGGVPEGSLARWKYFEVCGGVPGTTKYSGTFFTPKTWSDPCGGVSTSSTFATTVFADAILAMPQVCLTKDGTIAEDFITKQDYGKLEAWRSYRHLRGVWDYLASDTIGAGAKPLASGYNYNLQYINETTDFSLTARLTMTTQPLTKALGGNKIIDVGGKLFVRAFALGAGYGISVAFPRDDGMGSFILTSETQLELGAKADLAVTIDVNGEKRLYVNGTLDILDPVTAAPGFAAMKSTLALYANEDMRIGSVGAWDRVLSPAEVRTASLSAYELLLAGLTPDVHWAMQKIVDLANPDSYEEQITALAPSVHWAFGSIT